MSLTKKQIEAASDLIREEVDVPEWGGTVILSSMVLGDRESWEKKATAGDSVMDMDSVRARLLVLCIVDESGKRLYGDDELAGLLAKSAAITDRLFEIALSLNKLKQDDVEELAKNSPDAQD